MPKLEKSFLDKEVKRIVAEIPSDQRDTEDPYERLGYIYDIAYQKAWHDCLVFLGKSPEF